MSSFGKGVSQGLGAGAGCILALLTLALGLYGVLLHLFTVASIWTAHGAILGIISFFLPGIAEVYLLFMAAAVNPNGWANNYTAYFAIFVAGLIVRSVFLAFVSRSFRSSGESVGLFVTDEERTAAATLLLGMMNTGELHKEELFNAVSSAYPHFTERDGYRALKTASLCMLGYGVPEQFIEMPDDDDKDDDFPEESEHNPEIARIKVQLEEAKTRMAEAKAEIHLTLLSVYRERMQEGRLYDPVEATMTPLEASAVVMRFGQALEESPRECAPFARLSELADSKQAILNACKILYIHRWSSEDQRKHLSSGLALLHHFVSDEEIDKVLSEADGQDPMGVSKTYGFLLNQYVAEGERHLADWREFCARIDQRMEEIHAESEESEEPA